VFLAVNEAVAQDLADKLNGAAHEIDRLRNELEWQLGILLKKGY